MDILCVLHPTGQRDFHLVFPSLTYIQNSLNLKIKTVTPYFAFFSIIYYRPKLVVLPNIVGTAYYVEVAKICSELDIKIVSFISEGNVFSDNEVSFWGLNSFKKIFVDCLIVWNSKYYEHYKKMIGQEFDEKCVVGGATSYERYHMLKFRNKVDFLFDQGYSYKKIIGIASWCFDSLEGQLYESYKEQFEGFYSQEQIQMHRKDRLLLRDIYKQVIEQNPDILFILRLHPEVEDIENTEFASIDADNVYVSNGRYDTDYGISDYLNISDLWLGYETTTAMEAWLLDKTTLLVNPTTSKFKRENIADGSFIVSTAGQLQACLDEFYSTGRVTGFDVRNKKRAQILKDILEHIDGCNYKRCADYVLASYNVGAKQEMPGRFKMIRHCSSQLLTESKAMIYKFVARDKYPHLSFDRSIMKEKYNEYLDFMRSSS